MSEPPDLTMKSQAHKIRARLIREARKLSAKKGAPLEFTGNLDADKLINDLKSHPHAYVIACIMDRQMPAEKAWLIPYELKRRLGYFDFKRLHATSYRKLKKAMSKPTSLHRFPTTMTENLHSALQRIGDLYDGKASNIWSGKPSSAIIIKRFLEFKGVGQKIATMACNILVRDFRIPVSDRYSLDVSIDVQVRRVFNRLGLVPKGGSPELIIYTARALNPEYPGIFDYPLWELGREICRPRARACGDCFISDLCPSKIKKTNCG